MKSVKLYPLPITTEAEACALEGVGPFIARRMLLGLATSAAVNGEVDSRGPPGGPGDPGGPPRALVRGARHADNDENIGPLESSSSASSRGGGSKNKRDDVRLRGPQPRTQFQAHSSSSSDPSRYDPTLRTAHGGRPRGANNSERPLSLASNLSALRGDAGGGRTPDVTPKRPTSRARTEEVGDDVGRGVSSQAPCFFSGRWKALLVVDNREHEFMSMQVRGGKIGRALSR